MATRENPLQAMPYGRHGYPKDKGWRGAAVVCRCYPDGRNPARGLLVSFSGRLSGCGDCPLSGFPEDVEFVFVLTIAATVIGKTCLPEPGLLRPPDHCAYRLCAAKPRSAGHPGLAELRKHAHRFRSEVRTLGEAQGLGEGTLPGFVVGDQHQLPDVLVARQHSLQQRAAGT